MRSGKEGHGLRHPALRNVLCNVCPNCMSVLASKAVVKQHLKYAYIRGACKQGLGTQRWEVEEGVDLRCKECEKVAESVAGLLEHVREAHLPQPLPR
eukprot:1949051-Lingulodinium_polyedra.AAC.1